MPESGGRRQTRDREVRGEDAQLHPAAQEAQGRPVRVRQHEAHLSPYFRFAKKKKKKIFKYPFRCEWAEEPGCSARMSGEGGACPAGVHRHPLPRDAQQVRGASPQDAGAQQGLSGQLHFKEDNDSDSDLSM